MIGIVYSRSVTDTTSLERPVTSGHARLRCWGGHGAPHISRGLVGGRLALRSWVSGAPLYRGPAGGLGVRRGGPGDRQQWRERSSLCGLICQRGRVSAQLADHVVGLVKPDPLASVVAVEAEPIECWLALRVPPVVCGLDLVP